jgi:hypothetical protein
LKSEELGAWRSLRSLELAGAGGALGAWRSLEELEEPGASRSLKSLELGAGVGPTRDPGKPFSFFSSSCLQRRKNKKKVTAVVVALSFGFVAL